MSPWSRTLPGKYFSIYITRTYNISCIRFFGVGQEEKQKKESIEGEVLMTGMNMIIMTGLISKCVVM